MKQRTTHLLGVLVVLALLAGACGPAATNVPVEPTAGAVEPTAPAEPTAGADEAPGEALVVTDALGRTVQFAAPPQRIVVTGRSTLTIIETLFLFPEARERVVGIGVGRQKPGEFLSLVDPTYGTKTEMPSESGPEQIAPLQPDLVLLRSFMAEDLGPALEAVSIPVVYLDLETPEQYFRDVATLGQLLGNEARAAEIQAYYESRLAAIDAGLAELDAAEKPRVLLVQHSAEGGEVALEVPSAAWLQTLEVELAGGQPVWAEAAQAGGWTVVNFEQIAAWDPEQIYVISYDTDPAEVVATLQADPRWQALAAVQAGRIEGFAGDFYSWDQPDPRWILGVTWLAKHIHPDRFPELDLDQEIRTFFEEMYGLDQATIEAEILPRLRGNVE